MPVNEEHSTVSPVAKKDIMLKIIPRDKGRAEQEPGLTLSTSMPRRIRCIKEAKPKEAEWP
jgi:hypothetical protein